MATEELTRAELKATEGQLLRPALFSCHAGPWDGWDSMSSLSPLQVRQTLQAPSRCVEGAEASLLANLGKRQPANTRAQCQAPPVPADCI